MSVEHLGRARVITELKQRLEQVGRLRTPLLLIGEAGCGFELIAKMVHQRGTAWVVPADNNWLTQNPFAPLIEARDGSLFLERIEILNKAEQRGLSQLITKLDKFNTRLIATIESPLQQLIDKGSFDATLLGQLSGITLCIPSLREHPEDIPELASTILLQMIEANESPMRHFSMGALNVLRNLDWRGNLPVLQNIVKTLALTSLTLEITAEDVTRTSREFGLEYLNNQTPMAGVPLD
ncbi:MAG: sigma-54-dependent Fis family transcriptional regulator, partial [Betaproteobacteria bacterium]|nr:sigma-54-dependent Fis family transcriptional regulator [Betaproteobacteria bacterium]